MCKGTCRVGENNVNEKRILLEPEETYSGTPGKGLALGRKRSIPYLLGVGLRLSQTDRGGTKNPGRLELHKS